MRSTVFAANSRVGSFWQPARLGARLKRTLLSLLVHDEPRLRNAFGLALVVCVCVFMRSLWSNYIFDEQEALLANPYVNGHELGFLDAFKRDFWGLPPDQTIGSYRPLPNLVWWCLWRIREHPWPAHAVNLCMHALNAALVVTFAWRWSRDRVFAWLSGLALLLSAVLTEAVCGVVGLADILAGTAALLALHALALSAWLMPLALLLSVFAGLLCKESALAILPVLPWVAWVTAYRLPRTAPRRVLRAFGACLGGLLGLVAYTYFRRQFFAVDVGHAFTRTPDVNSGLGLLQSFLDWFRQPKLPIDAINNPLADAGLVERIGAAFRIYFRGLTQLVWPWPLSGDYSFAQELPLASPRQWGAQSSLGAVCMLLPLGLALYFGLGAGCSQQVSRVGKPGDGSLAPGVLAVGLSWIPLTYFPHSNLLVVLPTVRAERFWYTPMIGAAFLVALGCRWLLLVGCSSPSPDKSERLVGSFGALPRRFRWAVVAGFFASQALSARLHALDYTDDLSFWRATTKTSPKSAKAHLNYGVMLGARGELPERLRETERALQLAPEWPMAEIYLGDTLCRLQRHAEAWPHYRRGFELGPGEQALIALALQCLWDEGQIKRHEEELLTLVDQYPGSWLSYLAAEVVYNGERHAGVPEQYRPRGYDEGVASE